MSFLDQSQRAVRQTRCRASNDNFSKVLLGDHGKHKLQANKLTLDTHSVVMSAIFSPSLLACLGNLEAVHLRG